MGLVDYDSDSEERSHSESSGEGPGTAQVQDKEASDDSYFVESDSASEDSATQRARQAQARLAALDQSNAEDEATGPSGRATLLPDPMAVLSAVRHKPGYLDPEATRPLAAPIHSTRPAPPVRPPGDPGEGGAAGEKRKADWDISMMAPPLKGQAAPEKRGVISAAAKLNRPDREDDGIVTAAQVAMLGGQWRPSADGDVPAGPAMIGPAAAPGAGAKADARRRSTKAMPVADALAAGAPLPRRQQGLKEKQKAKADQGKRATGEWKSEAFMILRQQYD